jgi:hypothetical protein
MNQMKSFGDMSMLGSPNLHRGNAPLAMRLKIHDLHAQLAPLDRYGVGDMSLAITGAVRALLRRRYGPQCPGCLIARRASSIAG